MKSHIAAPEIACAGARGARKRRPAALEALTGLVAMFVVALTGHALASEHSSGQGSAEEPWRSVGSLVAGFMTDAQVHVLSAIVPAAAPTETSPRSAARFVERLGRELSAVIANRALAPGQRDMALRGLFLNGFEVETIGRIVLGRYWHGATPVQLAEYRRLFEKFLLARYADRFLRYGTARIALTGARAGKRNIAIIESRVEFSGKPSLRVDWLVRTSGNGEQRVIDLIVNGLSMAITQRYEFISIIENHGGDIEGLLAALRRKTT